jgi:hypothetical protein
MEEIKKIDKEFILLIMNCKKYIKKAEYQKKTWIKQLPPYLSYYHVLGEEHLETDFLFDNNDHILYVKTKDDYISLPKKVISAYSAIHQTFKYKYIYKTDDDQILVNPNFFNILPKLILEKSYNYGGFIVDVKKPHISQYYKLHPELPKQLPIYITKYCSGRFYFLSKIAVEDLLAKRKYIGNEYLEDYAIGYYLSDELKQKMLSIATNRFFTDIELSDFTNTRG